MLVRDKDNKQIKAGGTIRVGRVKYDVINPVDRGKVKVRGPSGKSYLLPPSDLGCHYT